MIQETRSSSVMGIFKSSMTLGNAVTTTVWSKAAMKAPRPVMVRRAHVERSPHDPIPASVGLLVISSLPPFILMLCCRGAQPCSLVSDFGSGDITVDERRPALRPYVLRT